MSDEQNPQDESASPSKTIDFGVETHDLTDDELEQISAGKNVNRNGPPAAPPPPSLIP
jgi:hypothetical protein